MAERTLLVMRHAKSSWATQGLADHDRPLNRRGRAAAAVMACWLESQGLVPDRVLCSTALRTRETAALMRDAVSTFPMPDVEARLYHADAQRMAALLREVAEAERLMLIGHQPGLSALVAHLAMPDADPDCARAFEHFPTGAIAVLRVGAHDWANLDAGCARFTAFSVPRELA